MFLHWLLQNGVIKQKLETTTMMKKNVRGSYTCSRPFHMPKSSLNISRDSPFNEANIASTCISRSKKLSLPVSIGGHRWRKKTSI